jgi:uncharacterized membrane protein YcaP (DUF421 family)
MRAVRITREEVLAAMRADGAADVADVAAVVVETDGSISILGGGLAEARETTLASVDGYERASA